MPTLPRLVFCPRHSRREDTKMSLLRCLKIALTWEQAAQLLKAKVIFEKFRWRNHIPVWPILVTHHECHAKVSWEDRGKTSPGNSWNQELTGPNQVEITKSTLSSPESWLPNNSERNLTTLTYSSHQHCKLQTVVPRVIITGKCRFP